MQSDFVLEMTELDGRRGWFNPRSRRRARVPKPREDELLFLGVRGQKAQFFLRELSRDERHVDLSDEHVSCLITLRSGEHPLCLNAARVGQDSQERFYDLKLVGTWRPTPPEAFIQFTGRSMASPGVPLSNESVVSWILQELMFRISKEVAVRPDNAQGLTRALPASWWTSKMNTWLRESAIQVSVDKVSFQSAEADVARRQEEMLARRERAQRALELKRDIERREREAAARHELAMAAVDQDVQLTREEREHKLVLMKKRHLQELIQADTAIEEARRQAQAASAEQQAAEELSRNNRIHVRPAGESQSGSADQPWRSAELDMLVSAVLGQRSEAAQEAIERLTSPEFAVDARVLASVGAASARNLLVGMVRDKAHSDGEPVKLSNSGLQTRDIGTATVRGLPLNSSVRVDVRTARAGHILVLNLGTSGACWMHVPNAYVGPERAIVAGDMTYSVPGPELLPRQALQENGLEYVEVGPPGWEHVLVILSSSLTGLAAACSRTTPGQPFTKLSESDLESLGSELVEADPEAWTGNVLSFLVG